MELGSTLPAGPAAGTRPGNIIPAPVRPESANGRRAGHDRFGGDVAALVAHFVEESPLDRDQIEQLRRLLTRKKVPGEKRT